jgi:hypothetical protein
MSFKNNKGIPTATQLRCKVGEDQATCKARLEADGWQIPANASFTDDKSGTIITLPE